MNSFQSTVYMRRTGAYGSENYQLMAAMKEWAKRNELLEDSIIYGIAYDNENTPPEQCRYDVCLLTEADCPVDELVQRGELPGGKYAVFTIPHTAEAVQGFWSSVIQVLQEKAYSSIRKSPFWSVTNTDSWKMGSVSFASL